MVVDLTGVAWRKAQRSTANGGNCVEVGLWRKSSHSGANDGNCAEVGVWRKSSRSTANGGDCVEVGVGRTETPDRLIVLRDSKDPDGPKLYLTPTQWHAFRHAVRTGAFDSLS